MGTIVTSGAGSGLDISGLVSQLVQAEGQAKTVRLDVKEAAAQGRLSAFSSLRSALAELRSVMDQLKDIDAFRGRAVALNTEEFISPTATSSAVPGNYSIEVEQLALAHRLASQAFTDQTTVVGTGTLTLSVGASSFAVDITSTNNSVAGIANAINTDSANSGVFAAVINGVDGARLILSAAETGAANTVTVTQAGGDGGLAALVYDPGTLTNLTELQPPQDARVLINTFAVTSPTNTISGAIEGVDIALLATNQVGETTEVSVEFDKAAARATVDKLVESYNTLVDTVTSIASFDAEAGIAGPLFGDVGLRNIVFQLRRELSNGVPGLNGPFERLQELGVETELDGKLSIDSDRLDAAFATNFDAIGELFADADAGLAVRIDAVLESYLKSDGVLDSRNATANSEIEDITEQRERLATRLTALEARLFRQFNALDGLLAQLQTTSGFLNQQLSSLPGSGTLLRSQR